MKILLFGNVGCGKSTLSGEILKFKEQFRLLNIDDFRRKFSDGSMKMEIIAKERFIEAIEVENSNQIIECSGLGDTGEMVFQKLYYTNDVIIVYLLLVDSTTCIKRLTNRVWDIPYPSKTTNVNKLIEKQEEIYKADTLKIRWGNLKNTIYLSSKNNSLNDLNINCQRLLKIIDEADRNN